MYSSDESHLLNSKFSSASFPTIEIWVCSSMQIPSIEKNKILSSFIPFPLTFTSNFDLNPKAGLNFLPSNEDITLPKKLTYKVGS